MDWVPLLLLALTGVQVSWGYAAAPRSRALAIPSPTLTGMPGSGAQADPERSALANTE